MLGMEEQYSVECGGYVENSIDNIQQRDAKVICDIDCRRKIMIYFF